MSSETSPRSRRTFLRRSIGALAGAVTFDLLGGTRLIGRALHPGGGTRRAAGNPLRLPPTFAGDAIVARAGRQEVWPGEETPVWTYGGNYPAPTIRLAQGDRFAVQLQNRLDEGTIIHWHGHVIPAEMDGHPTDVIGPGETYDYAFDIVNRAGTYWYHPHAHERTAAQTYMGMAGFFIVSDNEEQALGLPSGKYDVPLLLQDRRAATTHRFSYEPDAVDILNGLLGDTLLVNGTPDAYLDVEQGLYRFRILNGSNARIMKLGFEGGKTYHVIGTDGGLIDRPYEVETSFLAPGERLEILVDFADVAIGESLQFSALEWGGATSERQPGFPFQAIRFDVTAPATESFAFPESLTTIERIDPADASHTRIIELQTAPFSRDGHHHHINGKVFDMHRVDEQVRVGSTEIWEVRNTHSMPHPFHIHGVQYQILERIDGVAMEPRDYGWKDTVLIWGYETVRLAVPFSDHRGVYVFHCHNLEHEDGGMMLNMEVGDEVMGVEDVSRMDELDLR